MTPEAFQAQYESVTGTFQDNSTRDIVEETMRDFSTAIRTSFVPLEGTSLDISSKLEDDFLSEIPDVGYASYGDTEKGGYWTGDVKTPNNGTIKAVTTGMNSTENCQGVIELTTAGSSTGYAQINTNSNTGVTPGLGSKIITTWRTAFTTLSDGTNRFTAMVGLGLNTTTSGTEPTTGIYFRYCDNVNSGRWQCVVITASSSTTTDSGFSPTATVNQMLTIEIASDRSSVKFYIDGTLVVTTTTNIPTTSSVLRLFALILKSVGSTSRNILIDYASLVLSRTTSR